MHLLTCGSELTELELGLTGHRYKRTLHLF